MDESLLERYRMKVDEIYGLMRTLQDALDDLPYAPNTWGEVGDLGHLAELLKEAATVLGDN